MHGAEDALRRLRCVWISHIHADHHVGLPTVLTARRALLGEDEDLSRMFGFRD